MAVLVEVRVNRFNFQRRACIMVRKFVFALGILLGVSALVIDGSASTAEACWGCRSGCGGCGSGCWRSSCGSSCYRGCFGGCHRSCCSSGYSSYSSCYAPVYAAPVYGAPGCSSCSARYAVPGTYGYVTPINVAQVPGYGDRYGYSAAVISAPVSGYRVRTVSLR
jgi:hypothetical protein